MKLFSSVLVVPAVAFVIARPGAPAFGGAGSAPRPAWAALSAPEIVLNQVGVPGHWPSDAFLIGPPDAALPTRAEVVELATERVVARLPVGRARLDAGTGDALAVVKLPPLRAPGRYEVRAGALRSPSFAVGPDVYHAMERQLLRSFYLQRCGPALDDRLTGAHHGACHGNDAAVAHQAEPTQRAATGGWHDAGDYGKYVATTAVSIGRVLSAYERDPGAYAFDNLDLPESGNGIPDVLDEMKVGLDWMLTMQRGDGAVYRKVGGKAWPKKLTPDRDVQPRLLYGVSSPETAKAAAAWALGARLLRRPFPDAAERYLAAAQRAWAWVEQQPAQVFDWREGDDSGSGPYRRNEVDQEESLTHHDDDRLWAAAELAITTGQPRYFVVADQLAARAPINLFEWKDASLLALTYYLWHPAMANVPNRRALAKSIAARLVRRSAAPLAHLRRSGYRIANPRFVWGSNKMTVEEGVMMCWAYRQTKRPELLAAARDQLHYVLGRNHFGTSFVSGASERSVRHVTHIFAEAAGLELPGLFVGGPNDAEQSGIAPRGLGPRSWVDDRRSYATNEYAIDYNASLLGLLAMLRNDCAS